MDNRFWVARDKDGTLTLFCAKPIRDDNGVWYVENSMRYLYLNMDMLPDLTCDDDAIEVSLCVKDNQQLL